MSAGAGVDSSGGRGNFFPCVVAQGGSVGTALDSVRVR